MKIEMWESVNLKKYIGGDTSGLTKLCKLFPYEFAPCTMKEQGGVRNDRLYWKLQESTA